MRASAKSASAASLGIVSKLRVAVTSKRCQGMAEQRKTHANHSMFTTLVGRFAGRCTGDVLQVVTLACSASIQCGTSCSKPSRMDTALMSCPRSTSI